jgi:hypothetical protein
MLEGYKDLRNELTEIFGGKITEDDIDAAVQALINEDHTTATPALAELNSLAQTAEGKEKLRGMLAHWITHERDHKHPSQAHAAAEALNHLLEALGAERRKHAERVATDRRQ